MPYVSLAKRMCSCIKKVRKTVKLRRGFAAKGGLAANKEKAAIGICVKSVLQTRGKTLKRFSCRKPMLKTQPINSVYSTKAR